MILQARLPMVVLSQSVRPAEGVPSRWTMAIFQVILLHGAGSPSGGLVPCGQAVCLPAPVPLSCPGISAGLGVLPLGARIAVTFCFPL